MTQLLLLKYIAFWALFALVVLCGCGIIRSWWAQKITGRSGHRK